MKFIKSINNLKLRFLVITLLSMTALMIFFAICRFCGIGYFKNNYPEQEPNIWVIEITLYLLKFFEAYLIVSSISRAKAIPN